MGTGKVGNLTRAGITPRRTAVLTVLGLTAIVGALLFPFAAPAHDASDFFVFAKASFGVGRNSNELNCNGSNDKQADVSGSGNQIHGRIHSNADIVASSGATNTFHNALTYGRHDEDCQEQSEALNTYLAGQPTDVDADPSGVIDGWPGDLNSYLTGGLTFATQAQALPGTPCQVGDLTLTTDYVINPATDSGKVICRGTGKVSLNVSNTTLSLTILSHGPIEISGQNVTLTPAQHGIVAFTDRPVDVAIKLSGSDFKVPETAIFFAPRGGIDTSGSDDAELCIQLIGQGPIKVPGSNSVFGPGSSACTGQPPQVSVNKTPDAQTINAGQPATFTMTATNNGPGVANITLNDNLPLGSGGLTWVESSDPSSSCTVSAQPPQQQTLSCSFLSVPASQSRTVSVTTQTDQADCAALNNTATVSSTGDNTPNDNSNSGSITITCPDVSVVKTGNGTITAPANAQFTMVITNNGPGTATGVGLTDNLPGTGWAITAQTAGNCSLDVGGDILTCSGINMAAPPNSTYSVTVQRATVAPTDCGPMPNTATVTMTGDTNSSNNQSSATVTVQCPDISVLKTGNGPITAGDEAEFTMVITNHGPGTALGVGLTDNLPGTGWSIDSQTAGNCSVDAGGDNLTCSGITLTQGATYTVVVVKTTTNANCGNLDNTATVSATNEGTNQQNNTSSATILVNCPDLTVTKTGNGTITAGETARFTIVITNLGPGTATGVGLNDPLPGAGWSIDSQTAGNCSVDGTGANLTCSGITLLKDGTYTVVVSRATTNADCADLENTATVFGSNEGANTNNNESTDTVVVNCPDITVTKDGNGPVQVGGTAEFTITIKNLGPGQATGVSLNDTLVGEGWAIFSQTNDDCGITAGVLSCSGITLAQGGEYEIVIRKTTTLADCADIPNTATVSATNENPQGTAPNSASDTVVVLCADISVSKTPDAGVVQAGDLATFTITVTNSGDGSSNVSFDDQLPDGGLDWSTTTTGCAVVGTSGDQDLECSFTLAGQLVEGDHGLLAHELGRGGVRCQAEHRRRHGLGRHHAEQQHGYGPDHGPVPGRLRSEDAGCWRRPGG